MHRRTLLIPTLAVGGAAAMASCADAQTERPNILIIMVDDMGYSDIGCYGGEIETPNIDRLAANGLRYTQFYNTARSCPTRASLITGLNPQQAGVGWMVDRDLGQDGYQGDLSHEAVTIPEVMRTAGYATYMSGKWHVVGHGNGRANSDDKSNWPLQRGFDRYFGIIQGAANYWKPKPLTYGNDPIDLSDDPDFFLTDYIARYMADFLRDHAVQQPDKPFFAYLAFNAPHWPLHAREETIAKYEARYAAGWDSLRVARYERMVEMGLIDPSTGLSPRDPESPAWDSLDEAQRREMQHRMAIYAAQIDEMDRGVGEVVRALEESGQLDNTLILFLSDNGACAEAIARNDLSFEAWGKAESFQSYRLPWANLSTTPLRLFKHWVHEGGISSPLVAHWPAGIAAKGELRRQPYCLIDLMATCVDLGGATYPAEVDGHAVPAMEGRSLAETFVRDEGEDRYLYWEHEGNCAVRYGQWKLVMRAQYRWPFFTRWELYDLSTDRSELHDLSAERPDLVRQLSAAWDEWAATHKVYPLDGRSHDMRIKQPVYDFPEDVVAFQRALITGKQPEQPEI